jgi:hypothetical protein
VPKASLGRLSLSLSAYSWACTGLFRLILPAPNETPGLDSHSSLSSRAQLELAPIQTPSQPLPSPKHPNIALAPPGPFRPLKNQSYPRNRPASRETRAGAHLIQNTCLHSLHLCPPEPSISTFLHFTNTFYTAPSRPLLAPLLLPSSTTRHHVAGCLSLYRHQQLQRVRAARWLEALVGTFLLTRFSYQGAFHAYLQPQCAPRLGRR